MSLELSYVLLKSLGKGNTEIPYYKLTKSGSAYQRPFRLHAKQRCRRSCRYEPAYYNTSLKAAPKYARFYGIRGDENSGFREMEAAWPSEMLVPHHGVITQKTTTLILSSRPCLTNQLTVEQSPC